MVSLSIIVPVYNVEKFLRECLDSILRQQYRDFEIIAVDDCSPDGSAAILQDYAQADNRLKIVRLQENVGLGLARNVGLEHATGDYVWFIDSDDYLFDGAIGSAMSRIIEKRADVAIVDWVRSYPGGRQAPGTASKFLAEAPPVFDAVTTPAILQVLQVAWNKVIRRDRIEALNLRFDVGWYEDTSFTYPLLLGSSRITTVAYLCIAYRQQNAGSITATPSARHFEVFYHWERAYRLIEENGGPDTTAKGVLFQVMLRHCLHILLKTERLPKETRRDFVQRLRSLYCRYNPGNMGRAVQLGERIQRSFIAMGSLTGLQLQARLGQLRKLRPSSHRRR